MSDYEVSTAALEPTRAFVEREGIQPGMNTLLLVHRALERGVQVSGGSEGRADLAFGGRTGWFRSGNSNLNSLLAKRTVNNKAALSRVLRTHGVRAPENQVFTEGEARRAWSWAESIAPVVVKPAQGKLGRLVHVDIGDFEEFQRAFGAVTEAEGSALVEQYVTGMDHRVTVVNGTVAGATRRLAANVVGDGISTVADLVTAKNAERSARDNPVHKKIRLGEVERSHLAHQGINTESIPPAGARVSLRGAANVSTGGDALDASDDLRLHEITYIEDAIREIPGLRVCGFDVLLDRTTENRDTGADPWILEINASPVISPHYFPWQGRPRDVMSNILEAMFPALRTEAVA